MSIYLGNKKLAGTSVKLSHNIGDIFFTSRTDTVLAGAVECNGATYQTTSYTGEGSIGELLRAGKLPYISLSQYASDLAAHGSVRAFGWNGGSTTAFRVPTLQNVFLEAGQAASAGEYISAGLPNITGNITSQYIISQRNNGTTSGAFRTYNTTTSGYFGGNVSDNTWGYGFTFDASRSNSIYGNSTTVQPNSVKYRAMVQLYNAVTDEALATCENVESDVADLKDMSNITATGKETIAHNAMPSDRIIALTLPAAGQTVTAPADGYIVFRKVTGAANQYIELVNTTGGKYTGGYSSGAGLVGSYCLVTCPVSKGDSVYVGYNATGATDKFQFVYANGAT